MEIKPASSLLQSLCGVQLKLCENRAFVLPPADSIHGAHLYEKYSVFPLHVRENNFGQYSHRTLSTIMQKERLKLWCTLNLNVKYLKGLQNQALKGGFFFPFKVA